MNSIKVKFLHSFQKEPRKFSPQVIASWNILKKATISGDLCDLCYCVDPPKISFRQSRPFRHGIRLGIRGLIIRQNSQQISHERHIK